MNQETIQTGILIATCLLAVIAIGGLWLNWKALEMTRNSLETNNRLLVASIVKHRWDMYSRTLGAVDSEVIEAVNTGCSDYFDEEVFDARYKGHNDKIRNYIWVADLYEHLAFVKALKNLIPGVDPVGAADVDLWLKELANRPNFREPLQDVHNKYAKFYPTFASFFTEATGLSPKIAPRRTP